MEYDLINVTALSVQHTPTWQEGRLLWARSNTVVTFQINGISMKLEAWGRSAGILKRYVKPGSKFSCKAKLQVHHAVLRDTYNKAMCIGSSGDAMNFIYYSFEIVDKTLKLCKEVHND